MTTSMAMSMSMPMSSTASSMAMSTGMSMSMGSGMDMSSDGMMSMMSMADMMMVFFTADNTPLFSSQWTPQNTGQYAGTCIFLIAFAVLFRGLLAIRSNFDACLAWFSHKSDTNILRADYDKEQNGVLVPAVQSRRARPWRINEALVRAFLDTIMAGVGYLLMLAVMTMNVGYFLSVLGGTFLGSFALGGWTTPVGH